MQVGNYIQHKGGVVTAEELAPYLDVPSAAKDADSHVVDESYVVPALVRFGGSPEVDQDNNLIYRFPSLQKTGRRQVTTYACICGALQCPNSWHCMLHDLCHAYVALSQCVALEASLVVTDTFLLEWIPQSNSSRFPYYGDELGDLSAKRQNIHVQHKCAWPQVAPTPSERFALEEEWKLTEATGGQKTGAIALGVANLVGVVILGGLLADPQTRYSLAQSSLSIVLSSFPALQVCPYWVSSCHSLHMQDAMYGMCASCEDETVSEVLGLQINLIPPAGCRSC